MKKNRTTVKGAILAAGLALAALESSAALPTLSSLAEQFSSLADRYADSTNRISALQTRFDALQSRLDETQNDAAAMRNRLAVLQMSFAEATNVDSRLEAAFNATSALREAFHGGKPVPRYVTNAEERVCFRVDAYPDGYEHIEQGSRRRILTDAEAALVAARRVERRTQLRKDAFALWKAKAAVALELAENGTNELDRAKGIVDLYAAKKQIARLEKGEPQTVTVTIKPQGAAEEAEK